MWVYLAGVFRKEYPSPPSAHSTYQWDHLDGEFPTFNTCTVPTVECTVASATSYVNFAVIQLNSTQILQSAISDVCSSPKTHPASTLQWHPTCCQWRQDRGLCCVCQTIQMCALRLYKSSQHLLPLQECREWLICVLPQAAGAKCCPSDYSEAINGCTYRQTHVCTVELQ